MKEIQSSKRFRLPRGVLRLLIVWAAMALLWFSLQAIAGNSLVATEPPPNAPIPQEYKPGGVIYWPNGGFMPVLEDDIGPGRHFLRAANGCIYENPEWVLDRRAANTCW